MATIRRGQKSHIVIGCKMCRMTHFCGYSLEEGCIALATLGLVYGGLGLSIVVASRDDDPIFSENFPTSVLATSIIGPVVLVIYIVSKVLLLWGTL